MAEMLQAILSENPGRCYYSIVHSDDYVGMFIFAHVPQNVDYAVVLQVWIDKALRETPDADVIRKQWLRFLMWCDQNDIKRIRIDNMRNDVEQICDWGFEPKIVVYELYTQQAIDESLYEKPKPVKEVESNGDSQRNEVPVEEPARDQQHLDDPEQLAKSVSDRKLRSEQRDGILDGPDGVRDGTESRNGPDVRTEQPE